MPLSHFMLAVAVAVVWGFNFVVMKIGLGGIPPLFLAFLRLFLVSFPAVFFLKRPNIPFKMLVLYSMTMFGLQFSFLFLGIANGVSAGLGSILIQLQVFFTIIFAFLILKERLNFWQITGAAVSFSGIAIVWMFVKGDADPLGMLLIVFAAISWGCGNIVAKKIGKVDIFSLVVWGGLISWPILLLMSLLVEGPSNIMNAMQHLTVQSGGAALYITYLSTLFAYCVWSYLISCHSLMKVAPFTLLVPICGIISSSLLLGESLPSWKISAGSLVILGLCINMFGPRLKFVFARA